MTEKLYRVHKWVKYNYSEIGKYIGEGYTDEPMRNDEIVDLLNNLTEENERLKYKINDLLYQIEYVGKNNKSCDGCECFLEDIGYCWMWDMNVKKEDIVVACDQRKVKNTK